MKKTAEQSLAVLPQESEIVALKEQLSGPQNVANNLEIKTQDDANKAADILKEISEVEKVVIARKESITKPIMASLSVIRDMFRPIENDCAGAKKTIKNKILVWQTNEEIRIEKEKNRIENRVEKGTMRADTASGKLEALGEAPTKSEGSVGKVSTRTVTKVRITDESLIPRAYLVPDMKKITEAIIRDNLEIAGVEKYEEKQLAIR